MRIDARIEEKRLFDAHKGFCVLNNLVPLTTEFFFAALETGSFLERRNGFVLGVDVRHSFADWIDTYAYETRAEREERDASLTK